MCFEKKTFRESNNYFYGIGLVIKHYELDIQRSKQSQWCTSQLIHPKIGDYATACTRVYEMLSTQNI